MRRLITLALLLGLSTPLIAQEAGDPAGGTQPPGQRGDQVPAPSEEPDPDQPVQRGTARPGEEPAPGQRPFAPGVALDEEDMKFDTNADGRLDQTERTMARQIRQARMIQRYDADGDGKLSDEERAKLEEGLRNYHWFRDEIGSEEVNEDFGREAPGLDPKPFNEDGTVPGQAPGPTGTLENQGPEPGSDENRVTDDGKIHDVDADVNEGDVDNDVDAPGAGDAPRDDDGQSGPDKIREQADERADALENEADASEDTLPEDQTDKMEDEAERLRDQADEQADAIEDREDD